MIQVHMIQHDDWVAPGEYLAWAERRGYPLRFTRCWAGDAVPAAPEADLLIVLGGVQNPATSEHECAYFHSKAEQALIRRAIEERRMVVGACLGAQMIGQALGAPFARSPERELGPVLARLTEEGRRDPLLRHFPDRFEVGAWHRYMPGLTADAEVLAGSEGCPRQIVRFAPLAYAFQAHLEFTGEIIRQGLRRVPEDLEEPGRFVQNEQQLLNYDYGPMNRLLSGFLDRLVAAYEG